MPSPLDELRKPPEEDPNRFRLPSEVASGRDFQSGQEFGGGTAPTTRRGAVHQERRNRFKAEDLADRGIPAYKTATGNVEAIRDESGAALSGFDSNHGVAWDSKGQPKLISYGEKGPPVLSDAFADLPVRTHPKTGAMEKKGRGLYQYLGQDPVITAANLQRAKDKAIKEESALLGRKLTLDEKDLTTGTKENKALTEDLQEQVPTLLDPKFAGADQKTVLKAIDEHFNAEYASDDANVKSGIFGGGELTSEAQTLRQSIDQRKAKAIETAQGLYGLKDTLNTLNETISGQRETQRAHIETLLAHSRGEEGPLDRPVPTPQAATGLYPPQEEWARMLGGEKAADELQGNIRTGTVPPIAAPAATATLADIQDAKDKASELEKTDPTAAERYKNFAASMLNGLTHGLTEIVKSAASQPSWSMLIDPIRMTGAAATAIESVVSGKSQAEVRKLVTDQANAIQKATGGLVDERLKGTVGDIAGNFIGGVAPFVALTVATKGKNIATPILMSTFYSTSFKRSYDDAKAKGVDDSLAQLAGIGTGAVNAVLAMPFKAVGAAVRSVFGETSPKVIEQAIMNAYEAGGAPGVVKILGKLRQAIAPGEKPIIAGAAQDVKAQAISGLEKVIAQIMKPAAQRLIDVGKEAAKAAALGFGVQTSENLIAKTYDPERGIFEGVTEQAIGFGVLAGVSRGFKEVVDARKAKQALDLIRSTKPPGSEPPKIGGDNAPPKPGKGPGPGGTTPEAPKPKPGEPQMKQANAKVVSETSKTGPLSSVTETPPVKAGKGAAPETPAVKPPSRPESVAKTEGSASPSVESPLRQKSGSPGTVQSESSGKAIGIKEAEQAFVEQGGHADKLDAQNKLVALREAFPDPAARIKAIEERLAPASSDAIDQAAHEASTSPKNDLPEPTQAQKEAGNYPKGHVQVGGLEISIENPAGSKRKPEFPPLKSHYGYIKGTVGADKEHVDIFVKQGTPADWSGPVFVVNQVNKAGKFDEHKAVLGVTTEAAALTEYNSNYEKGWTGGKSIAKFNSPAEFKAWAENGPKGPAPVSVSTFATSNEAAKMNISAPEGEVAPAARGNGDQVISTAFLASDDAIKVPPSHKPFIGHEGISTFHGAEAPKEEQRGFLIQKNGVTRFGTRAEAAAIAVTNGEVPPGTTTLKSEHYQATGAPLHKPKGTNEQKSAVTQGTTGEEPTKQEGGGLAGTRATAASFIPEKRGAPIRTVDDAKSAVERVKELHATLIRDLGIAHTERSFGRSGFGTERDGSAVITDYPAIVKGAATVESNGGDPEQWIKDAYAEEVGAHYPDLLVSAGRFEPIHEQIWDAVSLEGEAAFNEVYPGIKDVIHKGAEYLRMVLQFRETGHITESNWRNTSRMEAALKEKQSDVLEAQLKSIALVKGLIASSDAKIEYEIRSLETGKTETLLLPKGGVPLLEKPTKAQRRSSALMERLAAIEGVKPAEAVVIKTLLGSSSKTALDQAESRIAKLEPQKPSMMNKPPPGGWTDADKVPEKYRKPQTTPAIASQELIDKGKKAFEGLFAAEPRYASEVATRGSQISEGDLEQLRKSNEERLKGFPDLKSINPPPEALGAATPVAQLPIPKDKRAPMFDLIDAMEKEEITTPGKVAGYLEAISGGKARPYSQSLWDMMAAAGAAERGTHDWPALYEALTSGARNPTIASSESGAGQRSSVDAGARPPGEPVAEEAGGAVVPGSGGTGVASKLGDIERAGGGEQVEPSVGSSAGERATDVPGSEPAVRPGTDAEPIVGSGAGAVSESSSGPGRSVDAENHIIRPEDELTPAGDITRIRSNIAAIKLLKTLVSEDRNATPEEKRVLAKYIGWGGLPQVFDTMKGSYDRDWIKKYGAHNEALRDLLNPEEFSAARASTLNAHYTERNVIGAMWDAVRQMGFKGGNVAEFGAGVGHFFGLMPQDLAEQSRLQAIERDETSGAILQKLYPQARVRIGSLQDLKVAPNSVDLFVGNIPFAQDGPRDPAYPKLNLHNYFLARELDALRPGGVAVVISTHNTLDSQPKQREYLAGKAELVAAIRLPNTAFKASAGTEVVTDILIFRKPDAQRPAPEPFLQTIKVPLHNATLNEVSTAKQPIDINEYFGRHPDMILGLVSREGSMYGPDEPAIIPFPGKDLNELLAQAIAKVPKDIIGASTAEPEVAELASADAKDKPGSFIEKDGKLYIVAEDRTLVLAATENPRFKAVELKKRAGDFIRLRETYKDLLAAQLNPEVTEEALAVQREELNRHYDTYVRQHGNVNNLKSRPFSIDPEFGLMSSLEDRSRVEKDGKVSYVFKKADVFTTRTQYPYSEPTSADNVRDGLLASLAYRGAVKPQYVAELTGKTVEQVEKELVEENLAYEDPVSGFWQTNDHYLSGNVRAKLRVAESAASDDAKYSRNVTALQNVQPAQISIGDINVRLGGAWVPQEIVSAFGKELFNAPNFAAVYSPIVDTWNLAGAGIYTPEATSTYAGGGETGPDLFKLALNLKAPRVMDRVEDGHGGTRYVFNPIKTAAAQGAQDKITAEFRKYVSSNEEAAGKLEKAYNDAFNGHVLAKYDGSHLTLPGSSTSVVLRPHQKDAIWRIIQDGYAMLAHAVGAGKTYAMIGAAMEMRRLGIARKPMIVVKNPTLPQFAASFLKMYPSAKVLVGTKEDLTKERRNAFMSRIASGDWDAIVVAQSSFDRLPNDAEREKSYISSQITELEEAIREAKQSAGKRSPSVKDMEKAKDKLNERLKELAKRPQDNTINFEQLGVDALFIDEAHDYKKPPFVTKLDRVGGLNTQVSKRAFALLMKTRFIQEKNNGRNVILATGTPVTNTLGEAWHMLNLGAPHLLDDYGVTTFDRFVSAFAVVLPSMELNAAGNWVIKPRLAKFVNGPELLTMIRSGWDVLTTEELHEMFGELNIDVPKVAGGKVRAIAVPRTPAVGAYVEFLKQVYTAYQQTPNKKEISAVPIMAYMSGRVAALDPRLIDATASDDAGSKVNTAIAEIVRIYHETTPSKSTQLVFMENYRSMNTQKLRDFAAGKGLDLDMGAEDEPAGEVMGGFNLFSDIKAKLIKAGVKPDEIAIINDYETETQKAQLFDAMNAGTIRIMLGGTQKMGVGVNVQQKLKALHHLDAPWMPSDLEQREGRAIRQGNENEEVDLLSYGMINTLDAGLYTKIAAKAKFLRQVLSGRFTGREFDDPTGPLIVSAEEQQALLSGNPLVLKKVEVDNKVRQLSLEKEGYDAGKSSIRQRAASERAYFGQLSDEIGKLKPTIEPLTAAIDGETWKVKIGVNELTDRKQIIAAINNAIDKTPPVKQVQFHDAATINQDGNLILEFTANGVEVRIKAGLYSGAVSGGVTKAMYSTTMKWEGTIVYSGEAKTGVGILGALTDLPTEISDKVKRREERAVVAEADLEKFIKLLTEPFDKQAELDEALAEQARINTELLGTGKASNDAAEELFETGYSAVPLLNRIDAQLDRLHEQLFASDDAENYADRLTEERENEIEARIDALTKRRGVVEKRRYQAALDSASNVPYGFTKSKSDALYAATPIKKASKALRRKFAPGIDILTDVKEGIQSLLLPSAQGPEHLQAAELIGAKLGPMHRRQEASRASLKKDWLMFEKMGVHREDVPLLKNPGIQFMSDIMQAKVIDPKLQAAANRVQGAFAARVALLEKADAPLQSVRENYFPGMWTLESRKAFNAAVEQAFEAGIINENFDPNRATGDQEEWIKSRVDKFIGEGTGSDTDALKFLTRQPLKGPESFRKAKVFDDVLPAVRLGLRPISENPVDLVTLKLAEMDRSIMANEVFQALKAAGRLKKVTPFEAIPAGWEKVNDRYGTIYGPRPTAEDAAYIGLQIFGYRIVPKATADILNNYLSSSLYNNRYFGKLFTGWMGFANALNQTQLGVGSAFHAGFTTVEAQVSAGANLVKDVYGLLRGNRSLSDLIRTSKAFSIASVETGLTGDKVLNAWRNPDGSIDPRIAQVVRAAEVAGAGFKLERGLQTDQVSKFVSDWLNGHRLRAARRSPVAFVEMLAKPIMEFLVPRQKAGVFAHMAWRVIESNPGKSIEELAPELRQAWNRVDARLGQVRYDRLFINNAAKNVIQGLVRAPGWSGGTIAELGGSFKDTYKFFEQFAKTGKLPADVPDRVAYTISLLVGVTLLNGLLTYLFTGDQPDGIDYFAFRTGGKDQYGNPQRWVLPTYVKDILHYVKEPLTTLLNKSHPILSVFGDLFRNKDYYGVEIRDSDSNKLMQAVQSGGYVAKAFTPFWIRGAQKEIKQEGFGPKALLPLVGIMPATRNMTQTAAQELASKINSANLPAAPITVRQSERRQEKSEIMSKIRRGLDPDISGALSRGTIKPTDVKSLYKRGQQAPIAAQVDHMTLENAELVYARANAAEKMALAPIIARKRANSVKRQRKMFQGF